jgi:hypothetical protein
MKKWGLGAEEILITSRGMLLTSTLRRTDVAGPVLACLGVQSDGPSLPLDLVVAEVVVVNH